MFYYTSGLSRARWRDSFNSSSQIAALYSPSAWRNPFCLYACDNDVYAHSFLGNKTDVDWWQREGETAWLKMLDKVALHARTGIAPQFLLLPDVVGDWNATIERAHHYRREVNGRHLPTALALQDGAELDNFKAALLFKPNYVFIGGSTRWKWHNARRIAHLFPQHYISVHLGRVNGEQSIRMARGFGVASCDGTGISRHVDAMMPGFKRGFEMPAARFREAA
jgi:hypothetical protein